MTLPSERLGDKGQRYVIMYVDHDSNDEKEFGFANKITSAEMLLNSCTLWPTSARAWMVDRRKL